MSKFLTDDELDALEEQICNHFKQDGTDRNKFIDVWNLTSRHSAIRRRKVLDITTLESTETTLFNWLDTVEGG